MAEKLLQYIRCHDQTAWIKDGRLYALDQSSFNDGITVEVVELPVSYRAVRDWLGY